MGPCPLCGADIWQQLIEYPTHVATDEETLVETRVPGPGGPVTTSTCTNGHITKS